MSRSFESAQRAYDAMEPDYYWQPNDDRPDPRDEFMDGFSLATGIQRGEAYGAWLTYVGGDKPQRWVDAQEEAGWESGFEHGLLFCIDTKTPRATWAAVTLEVMRSTRRNVREAMEAESAKWNPNGDVVQVFPRGRW